MQAAGIQTKAEIRDLLRQLVPKLSADKWAAVLSMYLKMGHLNDVSSLSLNAHFEDLKESADDEDEANGLRDFIEKVGLNTRLEQERRELANQIAEFAKQRDALFLQAQNIEKNILKLKQLSSGSQELNDFIHTVQSSGFSPEAHPQFKQPFCRPSDQEICSPSAQNVSQSAIRDSQIFHPHRQPQSLLPNIQYDEGPEIQVGIAPAQLANQSPGLSPVPKFNETFHSEKQPQSLLPTIHQSDEAPETEVRKAPVQRADVANESPGLNHDPKYYEVVHQQSENAVTQRIYPRIVMEPDSQLVLGTWSLGAPGTQLISPVAAEAPSFASNPASSTEGTKKKKKHSIFRKSTKPKTAKTGSQNKSEIILQQVEKQTQPEPKDPILDKKEKAGTKVQSSFTSVFPSKFSVEDLRQHKGLQSSIKIKGKSGKDVLSLLALRRHYPEKIAFNKLIEISNVKPVVQPLEVKKQKGYFFKGFLRSSGRRREKMQIGELAWNLLRGLLYYDGTVRDLVPSLPTSASVEMHNTLFDERSKDADPEDNMMNPMDILLACYLCCDKEVQQIICRTLFTCKLAFPFVYSSSDNSLIMSNWSLRDIVVEFRDQDDRYIETSLISDTQFRVVSFVRIGELALSKSRLINLLLNDKNHATFFHRDLRNGHVPRVFSNGLIEATVFLPTPGSKRLLDTPFLATNLRGDALQFSEQLKSLTEVSQICVAFVDIQSIAQSDCFNILLKFEQNANLILILFKARESTVSASMFSREQNSFLERTVNVVAYSGSRQKNENELVSDIEVALVTKLTECHGIKMDALRLRHARTDESEVVEKTKIASQKVLKHFSDEKIALFKKKHLPLQGIWLEYSQIYKVENSAKTAQSDQMISQQKRIAKRNTQIKCCESLSPFIENFIKYLIETLHVNDGGVSTKLLLQWMKLTFDGTSRKMLPQLHRKCHELRDEIQKKRLSNSSSEAAALAKVEANALDSSVGLENVFREVGQIFECANENSTKIPSNLVQLVEPLPKQFARLLLQGVPLEILDGDAGNIPSYWISAVLKCCKELVSDKKIYVISVLGLQSSGKSTLLNTMFGLKFAVSAGRCTRGAFLQLVPVESGMPFNYIAVIDTEGLRAPELGLEKHHHDNELATLVIGLGDVTIINIKGENAAEMKDVLQIAIHAFIRMKMANKMRDLHRHCIFIHQNVPAVGAKEKMQEAAFKMQQTLDAITKEAAEGEGLKNIQGFSDIIAFDKESDIFYMSDLWQGDPPMAPVNPGYSLKVSDIKHYLLHLLENENKNFLNFVDFSTRINDLWKAILSEDFVFSFKNSIELKAYTHVEREFSDAINIMEQAANDWLHKEASVQLKKCLTIDALQASRDKRMMELTTLLDVQLKNGRSRLEKYFDENQYSEYTIQWKDRKLLSLQTFAKELSIEINQKINILFQRQKTDSEQEPKKAEWERVFLQEARSLAKQMRRQENTDTSFLRAEFERLWSQLMNSLPAETSDGMQGIENLIIAFLKQEYEHYSEYLKIFLAKTPLKDSPTRGHVVLTAQDVFLGENSPKLINTTFFARFKWLFSTDNIDATTKTAVLNACNEILASVKLLTNDINKQTMCFSRTHVVQIQKHVQKCSSSAFRNLQNSRICPTPAMEIMLVVQALRIAYPHFVEVDSRFRMGQSLKGKLAQNKEQMWNMFQNLVQQHDSAKVAADFCRDHLSTVIKDAIQERMVNKMKNKMMIEIGRTKYQLIVAMLTDMAKRDDFQSIVQYAQHSHPSALAWITEFTNKRLFTKDKGRTNFCQIVLSELICPMIDAIDVAANLAATNSLTVENWIINFCEKVEVELAVLPDSLQNMCQFRAVKVEDMMIYFLDGLQSLKSDLERHYSNIDDKSVHWHGDKTLYANILHSLWGCTEQCPFCDEPCQKADANHYENDDSQHCCIQHRPVGVCGVFWIHRDELDFNTCEYSIKSTALFQCQFFCKRKGKQTDSCCSAESTEEVWHPYNEFKKYFPEWEIVPDAANTSAKFWMWFCWTFQNELREKWKKGLAELSPAWQAVTKQEAIDSLRGLLD